MGYSGAAATLWSSYSNSLAALESLAKELEIYQAELERQRQAELKHQQNAKSLKQKDKNAITRNSWGWIFYLWGVMAFSIYDLTHDSRPWRVNWFGELVCISE